MITPEIKDNAIKTKGYFIFHSQLFTNVVAAAHKNNGLNTDLAGIFTEIEASASSYSSEDDIKGLFTNFDTTCNRLGNTVKDKNDRLTEVEIFKSALPGISALALTCGSHPEPNGATAAPKFILMIPGQAVTLIDHQRHSRFALARASPSAAGGSTQRSTLMPAACAASGSMR